VAGNILKMKNICLILLSCLILGCNSLQEAENLENDSLKNQAENPDGNPEYLDFQKMLINNKFPMSTEIKNIENLMGKPDSIVKVDNECQGVSEVTYYYGLTHFVNEGNYLDMNSMNFAENQNLFIQYGSLRLDHNTTLEEIKKLFPESSKDISKLTTDGIKGELDVIGIRQSGDGQWLLMFQNGKLVRLDDWFPC
jgi:hypothetical protein